MADSVQYLTITREDAGQRVDNFLIRTLKGVPRPLVYRIIRKGEVRLNKGRVKPDRKLDEGDILRIPPVRLAQKTPVPKPGKRLVSVLEQSILLDKGSWLVMNKPAGIAVHGGSGVNLGLIEALRQMWPESRSLELVHRLDRETSGCILVAKKRSALKYLQALFREEKQIRKSYLALVSGQWSKRKRVVDAPLVRNELQSGERMVRVNAEGKRAKTVFSVEECFALRHVLGEDLSLVRAEPVTGRTHQIRVHGCYAGHALIGDGKYGDEILNKKLRQYGIHRLFLHARALEFTDPEGLRVKVEAPLPDDLKEGLDALRSLQKKHSVNTGDLL